MHVRAFSSSPIERESLRRVARNLEKTTGESFAITWQEGAGPEAAA